MGIPIFHKSSFSTFDKPVPPVNPNPDPSNYQIRSFKQIGNSLILEVHYPDCLNYEGNKIMVFENCTLLEINKQRKIDPHFSSNKELFSPVARFEPSPRGWAWAIAFAKSHLY